jgi:hypothetical protein
VDNPRARRVVVYTWNFHPDLVSKARGLGVNGTSPRRSRPASWSARWRPSMPARSW